MRGISLLLGVTSVLALTACAQTTRWEKPQASEQATAADIEDCREQARKEAFRSVGAYPAGYPFYGPSLSRGWRLDYEERLRQERYFAENRLTAFCMQNKGYDRVVVQNPKS